jgi:integrase|tara:strand:+ start:4260 stop:5447 length:1188 start_codon:yes stop_codon:yes gene_type:complete
MGFLLHGKYNYVFFTFYIQGKKYRYSTKIKIDKEEWDLSIQRPKARRGDVGKANKKITFELNEYQSFYEKLKSDYKESLTKEIVKTMFDQHFQLAQSVKALTYSDYFDIYIEQKKESQSVKKGSWEAYARIHDAILEMAKTEKTTYYLTGFDGAFFNRFIKFLRVNKQISDNTLKRKMGFFKSFLNWCIKNGYQTNKAFKQVSIKGRETFHVSLTTEEVDTLSALELNEALDYYKDLFLIGVYSGQRYSDYSRFNKKFIDGNNIVIRAKKTGQFSYIPLNKKLKDLLDKYEWSLKLIASQKFNQHIQKICRIAGFNEIIQIDKFYGNTKTSKDLQRWQLIGSHTARRTFITLSAQRNVPKSLVMQATGIKSYKTLENYTRLDIDKLNQEMFKAWD